MQSRTRRWRIVLCLLALPRLAYAQAGMEFFIHGYNNFADTESGICIPDGPADVAIGPSRDCGAEGLCVGSSRGRS